MANDDEDDLTKEEMLGAILERGLSPEDFIEMLKEVQAEPEIECAHCGGIPDGVIAIATDRINRNHRICNDCAEGVLRWL